MEKKNFLIYAGIVILVVVASIVLALHSEGYITSPLNINSQPPINSNAELGSPLENKNQVQLPLTSPTGDYYVVVTGNESKYINLDKSKVQDVYNEIGKEKELVYNRTEVKLYVKSLQDRIYEECIKEDWEKGICLEYKNITYNPPNSLPVRDSPNSISAKANIPKKYDSKTAEDYFVYTIQGEDFLKIGDASIYVISNVSANGILEDTTAEERFVHLNISDSNLVAYYPMDTNQSAIAYDYTENNNDGAITEATWNQTSFVGGSYYFDGSNDKIIDESLTNAPTDFPFSFSVWAKKDGTPGGDTAFFSFANKGASDKYMIIGLNSDNKPFIQGRDTGTGIDTATSDTALDDGVWYHIVGVFVSSNNKTLYVDNVEKAYVTASSTFNGESAIGIGCTDRGSIIHFFKGHIDDVMFFDVSLTNQQISDIYNNQSARFKQIGTAEYKAVKTDTGNNKVNITAEFQNNMNTNLSARIGMINDSLNDTDNLVLYMPFEWDGAFDISGEDNDGTITGATWNKNDGLNNTGSFKFDGIDNYITNGNDISLFTESYTWSAWVNLKDNVNRTIMAKYANEGSNQFITTNTDGYLIGRIFRSNEERSRVTSSNPLSLNTWYHIFWVVSLSGNNASLFINNQFQEEDAVDDLYVGTLGDLEIGKGGYADGYGDLTLNYFNGTIDEIRIYNRSLLASEVQIIYEKDSEKFNTIYYTDYQNLTTSEVPQTFTITSEADYVFPSFEFISNTNQFYTPILQNNLTIETWTEEEAPSDTEYPIFSNYYDNNASLLDSGTGLFNVTVSHTNGTVILHINNTDIVAFNETADVYNASYVFGSGGVYPYNWTAYGNGSSANLNTSDLRSYTVNTSVPADEEYPLFSNYYDNNATQYEGGIGSFNATVTHTNGTVWVEYNGFNYSASNTTADVYNVSIDLNESGVLEYYWMSWGNGSATNFNYSSTFYYTVNSSELYEYYFTYDAGSETTINDTQRRSQNFTIGTAGQDTYFNITLLSFKGNTTIYAGIINVTIQNSSGDIISSGIFDSNNLIGDLKDFNVSMSSYTFNPSTTYEIIIYVNDAQTGEYINLARDTTSSAYAGGEYGYSNDGGSSWDYLSDYDLYFGVYGYNVSVADTIVPNVTIVSPTNTTYTTTTINFNVTALDETEMDSCLYSLNSGVDNFTMTNTTTAPTMWNATNTSMAQGSHTMFAYCNDTSNNWNVSESVTFFIDSIEPTCVLISRTPLDIEDNSTGIFEVIINCSDSNALNGSSALITKTVEGFVTPGLPNYWSIRPPSNNKGENSSSYFIGENIFVADGRADNKWYDNYYNDGVKMFNDNYSYSVQDNSSYHFTITEESSTQFILNFSWQVEPVAFRNSVYLSRGMMEKAPKFNQSIYKNNPFLFKIWNLEGERGSVNYTWTEFFNIDCSDNPNKNLVFIICNSSYDPDGSTSPKDDEVNCSYIDTFTEADLDATRNYISKNSSYVKRIYGVVDSKIAGVYATKIMYGFLYSQTTSTYPYFVKFANSSSGTNTSFKDSGVAWSSTNDGDTWTQAEFTPDIWLSQVNTNDEFQFGVSIEDINGNNYTNLTFIHDDIGIVNHPISRPNLLAYQNFYNVNGSNHSDEHEYLNGTYSGWMSIHVGISIDPDSVGNVTHNLTLHNTDGSLNYTINTSFLSSDDSDIHTNFNTSEVVDGIYRMNVTAYSGDNVLDIKSFMQENNFTIDNAPPSVTGLTEVPTDPANYSHGQIYEFNATITNGVSGIETVLIEFNKTNYSVSNSGDVYNFTITGLSAGTYNYTWFANDTVGNFNHTEIGGYVVNKTIPEGALTNTETWIEDYGTSVTIGLSESNLGDEDLTYVIYRDDVSIGTGETITLSVGTYEYVLNTTGGVNWTENTSMDTETLTINQITSEVNLTLNNSQQNISIYNGTSIDLNCSVISGDSGAYIELWNNGSLINNGTSPLGNTTAFNEVDVLNISCVYETTTNYSRNSDEWFVNVSAIPDTEYPLFSNYWDDNSSLVDSGTGHFNVTVTHTNGTVWLEIDGTNYTAFNETADVYNVSVAFASAGTWNYFWGSYGNGTDTNLNTSDIQSYTVNSSVAPVPCRNWGLSNKSSGNNIFNVDCEGDVTIYGDVVPTSNNTKSFGSTILKWLKGWFIEIDVEQNYSIDGTKGWTGDCSNLKVKGGIVIGCND